MPLPQRALAVAYSPFARLQVYRQLVAAEIHARPRRRYSAGRIWVFSAKELGGAAEPVRRAFEPVAPPASCRTVCGAASPCRGPPSLSSDCAAGAELPLEAVAFSFFGDSGFCITAICPLPPAPCDCTCTSITVSPHAIAAVARPAGKNHRCHIHFRGAASLVSSVSSGPRIRNTASRHSSHFTR